MKKRRYKMIIKKQRMTIRRYILMKKRRYRMTIRRQRMTIRRYSEEKAV